jgi:hypothetical protein
MANISLDIVELIENNPITRLSNNYKSSLLSKLQSKFSNEEQRLFVSSFYCYLNYNQKNDFVVDLDEVWSWLGFQSKYNAKRILEKHFLINTDYILSLRRSAERTDKTKGGQNKETILLNIKTFKLFCLKAGTKRAEQIHDYYISLEEILQEIILEESDELRLQLEVKTNELNKQIVHSKYEKEMLREKTLLEQFPPNTQCFYYGFIDDLSENNERLIKFGNSNFLKNRVMQHKKTYTNFRLVNVFKVENKIQIENAVKEHPLFKQRQRTINIKYNNNKLIELISIDDLTLEELDKTIKDIITSLEYSPEKYIKLLEENRDLRNKLENANKINNSEELLVLQMENSRLKLENTKLIRRYNSLSRKTNKDIDDNEIIIEENVEIPVITKDEINNYGNVINNLKKITRNKNGTYDLFGKNYELLEGTRQQVWEGKAYRTTGGLLKQNLMINKYGKLVSKRKCIYETLNNRLVTCGLIKSPNKDNSI